MKKIVVVSDLHIGRPNNNFEKMLSSIHKYLEPELVDCDLFVIAGDYFHMPLSLNHKETMNAFNLFSIFVEFSERYKFELRIIRGTYSHDSDQIGRFMPLIRGRDNIKYVDRYCIEEFDNMRFLYLSDTLEYQNTKFLSSFLYDSNITKKNKVDFIFSHGLYDIYRNKFSTKLPAYPLELLSKVTNSFIISGHIHTYNKYNKYISTGSFTRHIHGEEEHKGFVVCNFDTSINKWVDSFIKNEDTIPFISLPLDGGDLENNLKKVEAFVKKNFEVSAVGYLRLIIPTVEFYGNIKSYINEKYPYVNITYKSSKKEMLNEKFVLMADNSNLETLSNKESLSEAILEFWRVKKVGYNFNVLPELEELEKYD